MDHPPDLLSASRAACRPTGTSVNDIHSRLNRTTVRALARPESIPELQETVWRAAAAGTPLAFCGGRHAMGGQQFASAGTLVDTTQLNRVTDIDAERGLVTVQAGIDWPRLVNHLLWAFPDRNEGWGIIQKQTGADRLTIGGAL
jgi:FAD/FMN-containing dehydrogenase